MSNDTAIMLLYYVLNWYKINSEHSTKIRTISANVFMHKRYSPGGSTVQCSTMSINRLGEYVVSCTVCVVSLLLNSDAETEMT